VAIIRPEISGLPDYKPGVKPERELQRFGITDPIHLNSNEEPWGPFPEAIEAIQREAGNLNWYPDQTYGAFKSALSEAYGVEASQIIVGNGSASLIRLLGQVTLERGDEVLIAWPPYPNYLVLAGLSGATAVRVPLREGNMDMRAALGAVTERTKMVIIANPHNPTGSIVPRADLEWYFEQVPSTVVTLLDEAYFEFVAEPGYPDTRAFLGAGKPLLGLRTFSKAYGLAGMRIGVGFATPEISNAMHRARETFIISSLAAEAGIASLKRQDLMNERVRIIVEGREWMIGELKAMGMQLTPSQANFVFMDTKRPADDVVLGMLKRGIMIRSGRVHDTPTSIRVTVGLPEQNRKAVEALREVLAEVPEQEAVAV
jgi:histidinol-phosphate aminotransferase